MECRNVSLKICTKLFVLKTQGLCFYDEYKYPNAVGKFLINFGPMIQRQLVNSSSFSW